MSTPQTDDYIDYAKECPNCGVFNFYIDNPVLEIGHCYSCHYTGKRVNPKLKKRQVK